MDAWPALCLCLCGLRLHRPAQLCHGGHPVPYVCFACFFALGWVIVIDATVSFFNGVACYIQMDPCCSYISSRDLEINEGEREGACSPVSCCVVVCCYAIWPLCIVCIIHASDCLSLVCCATFGVYLYFELLEFGVLWRGVLLLMYFYCELN
jgi:hypothetical protein